MLILKHAEAFSESGYFHSHHEVLQFRTSHCLEFQDITDMVEETVRRSGIRTGTINIQTRHTTATILVNENEPLLLTDLKRTLERAASRKRRYQHDDFSIRTVNMEPDEQPNGHAHCKALFLRASETLNIHDSLVQIGRWQRVFFVELDRARDRSVSLLTLGLR